MSLITQYNNGCTRKNKLCNFAVIGSNNVKTVADRRRHAAYHNKQYSDKLFIGVNIDEPE